MHRIDRDRVIDFVASLQRADGSFSGDEWGEIDTRFSYCALSCLSLLGALERVDVAKAVQFIAKCKNFDGAFGAIEHAESHAGQTFCCVAALAIAGALDTVVDADQLGWWLAERQLRSGGLNGRPGKLQDVCYSFWVLSSLSIIQRLHWISKEKLIEFILKCQDLEDGGFSDRPMDTADVYHTFFALGGLSFFEFGDLAPLDPAYALGYDTLDRLGLKRPWIKKKEAE